MFWHKSKDNRPLKLIAAGAFAATVLVNALANLLPINGKNTGAISDSYPNLFAPAGVTFSIWSVIYILLAAYTLYQLGIFREKKSSLKNNTLLEVAPLFIATSLGNIAWIFTWHYEIMWLSVILMITILVHLIRINNILRDETYTLKEFFMVKLPFSIYFGWITVATIANVATWLVSINWDGFMIRPGIWTVVMLIVGAIIGLAVTFRNQDFAYGAVFIWAYTGILIKHLSPDGWNGMYPSTISALNILLPVFITVVLYVWLQNYKKIVR